MEEVGGLVPMDPHTAKVVTKKVVERVSRQETQTVWNPISVVGAIIKVTFGAASKVADGVCALLVGTRPDSERDTIKGVGGVLLEDKRVVDTVWLSSTDTDFDIVGKAGL
jgi:hypothetical protein